MTLRHGMGHSVKRTVKIGAVVSWYQFLLEILQKHYFQLLLSKTLTVYIALSLFDFLMNFQPIISPVNKDFLFD